MKDLKYAVRIDFDVMGDNGNFIGGDIVVVDVLKLKSGFLISPNMKDVSRIKNRKLNRQQVYLPLPPFCFRDMDGRDLEFDSEKELKELSVEILSLFNKLFD